MLESCAGDGPLCRGLRGSWVAVGEKVDKGREEVESTGVLKSEQYALDYKVLCSLD